LSIHYALPSSYIFGVGDKIKMKNAGKIACGIFWKIKCDVEKIHICEIKK